MKPVLNAPLSKSLKLTDDEQLSNVSFNFNLRRCAVVLRQGLTLVHLSARPEPFLSPKLHETTQRIPQKCSREAER
jgi:hypothetical protein